MIEAVAASVLPLSSLDLERQSHQQEQR